METTNTDTETASEVKVKIAEEMAKSQVEDFSEEDEKSVKEMLKNGVMYGHRKTKTNPKFKKYILSRSERARVDDKKYKKQVYNYARSFASAKVSLLREFGVVKNKRNDYTMTGDL